VKYCPSKNTCYHVLQWLAGDIEPEIAATLVPQNLRNQ
jgi:hypothetical protein